MKLLLPLAFVLTAAPAMAQDTTAPKRIVVGESSQLALQGWTRLNGTSAFEAPQDTVEAAPAIGQKNAARRARLIEAEAAYQAQKSKAKGGW